jgi:hypothetical protein
MAGRPPRCSCIRSYEVVAYSIRARPSPSALIEPPAPLRVHSDDRPSRARTAKELCHDQRPDHRRPAGRRPDARPKTAAGKARSARNALKHRLRARVMVLLDDEDVADFAAFEAVVRAELAPVGGFQADLVARIVSASWRARRADRLEAALLKRHLTNVWPGDGGDAQTALGYGLIRDGNGPRVLQTLVRYRGSVLAELFRALAALEARQARARIPGAGPSTLDSTCAETKRIRKKALKQRHGSRTTQESAS